jgi:hypothetical protein
MSDLFLDDISLLRFAKAIKARHEIYDLYPSKEDEANAAFEEVFWMPYRSDRTIPALEEYPNLNENLIQLLEAKISLAPNYKLLWEKYEFLRRMTAFESQAIMVEKPT